MIRRFPSNAETLQNLSLLIAFALIIAAKSFISAQPAGAALLIFLFSLPYLIVAIYSRTAYYLYGFMLFGAVGYFCLCYALGAPAKSFPLFSVLLVLALLVAGHYLRRRLAAEYASYSTTVFRAMNITVAVFAVWALLHSFDLLEQSGFLKYIAGLTYLGFSVVYLIHLMKRGPSGYSYLFSGFLLLGAGFTGSASWSPQVCWVCFLVAATIIVSVATWVHRLRTLRWSKHLYYAFCAALILALMSSFTHWGFVLICLSLIAIVLWQAYRWLAAAVGDLRRATTDERLIPRLLMIGIAAVSIPIVPFMFLRRPAVDSDVPAILLGVLFAWIAWERRHQKRKQWNEFVLVSGFFVAGGLSGIATQLPGIPFLSWTLVVSLLLLGGIVFLFLRVAKVVSSSLGRSIAETALFPALFAWQVSYAGGNASAALIGAGAFFLALMAVLLVGTSACAPAFGPALAGVLLSGAVLLSGVVAPWVLAIAASALALGGFAYADLRGYGLARQITNTAWVILALAGIANAASVSTGSALNALTAVTVLGVVADGILRRKRSTSDIFNTLVTVIAISATGATVILAASGQAGWVTGGVALVVVALSHCLSWQLNRNCCSGRLFAALFALGSLYVIFGAFPALEMRLGLTIGVVAILFVLGALFANLGRTFSSSCIVAGHGASITVAFASLLMVEPVAGLVVGLLCLPYAVIYASIPRLKQRLDMRVGWTLWLSLALFFLLAAIRSTPYPQQVTWMALLPVVWVLVGFRFQRANKPPHARSFYISATLLALMCGVVSLLASTAPTGVWQVFLLCGVVFITLFLLLRHAVFAYLVTLSLSLMAFDWIKISTTHFTQELFIYLVLGVGVLAIVTFITTLKRVTIRIASLPLFSIFTVRGTILFSAVGLIFAGLLGGGYAIRATVHPRFCTLCHNMGEYYDSWEHSSHKGVACLECHYEPGVVAHVEGKIGAVVQLAKFLTHSYSGGQPHALVSNASCMRPGCHDEMDNSKETLLFAERIRFRHDQHLGKIPRGKRLNCVSCHGQMIQGKHISVTETTCLTCHFYGRGQELVGIGDCQSCHLMPEQPVSFVGQSFSHKDFVEGNGSVRCSHCHSQVTEGDGSVSYVRCRTCHLEGELGEIEDQAALHAAHVSVGHFDCLQCHDEVKHGTHPMVHQLKSSSEDCAACHGGERHTIQERIYAGDVLDHLEPTPDWMYAAGVTCDGCHTDVQFVNVGQMTLTSKASGAKECSDCHGDEGYGEMLSEWQEETETRIRSIRNGIDTLDRRARSSLQDAERLAEVERLLQTSDQTVSYIIRDRSHGAHNYMYVSEMLDSAENNLEAAQVAAR